MPLLSDIEIEKLEEENAEKLKDIDDLKKETRQYNDLISQHSKQGNSFFDRDALLKDINSLKEKEAEVSLKFNELSELIPLAILTGKAISAF